MATGRPPFMHKNHHQLGLLIRNGNIIYPDPERHKIFMSENLKDLISKVSIRFNIFFLQLLDRNVATRLGSKGDVNEVISHPWFADVDFEVLQRREIEPPYKPDPEQMTLKETEIKEMEEDKSTLKDIKTEDEQDEISVDKKLLIHQNKGKFENF